MSPRGPGRLKMVGPDPASLPLNDLVVGGDVFEDAAGIARILDLAFLSWSSHHD